MKFDIYLFSETLSIKFKFHYNRTKIMDTLHEDIRYLTLSRSILLRLKNVLDESYRQNRNTCFMFITFFSLKSCSKAEILTHFCTVVILFISL